jgi:hypothetical protein
MLPCEALLHSDINTCLGDVGGQKTLRTYWKNYFEKTDTLIWVVDSTDRERLADCRQELEGLLVQEVRVFQNTRQRLLTISQRLMGASLLVFKNKSDVAGSMTEDEIREVCLSLSPRTARPADHHHTNHRHTGIALRQHSHAQVADHDVQRHDRREPPGGTAMGRPGRQRPPFPVLNSTFLPSLL